MRTYSRDAWTEAQEAWKAGGFSSEWREFRHIAAMRGMIFPPEGSKWDSWDDDSPSQRAMLIRAIREQPALLREAIDRSRSWYEVLSYLTRRRDEWRERQAEVDRDQERHNAELRIDHAQSVMTLSAILRRLEDSAA